jgi:hypothetical protein
VDEEPNVVTMLVLAAVALVAAGVGLFRIAIKRRARTSLVEHFWNKAIRK